MLGTPPINKDAELDEALHPNQQKLDVHEPEKDELTAKDFEKLRASKKAKAKPVSEESLTAGKRLISKHGEGAHTTRVYKDAEYNEYQVHHYKDGKHMGEGPVSYHSDKEDAESTAKASLKQMKEEVDSTHKKILNKAKTSVPKVPKSEYEQKVGSYLKKKYSEEVEHEDVDYTVIDYKSLVIELPENLTFKDYINAAKTFTESEEDAIVIADQFFKENDNSIVIESYTRSDIEDRVKTWQKAGHRVGLPKYTTKDGKMHAEFTVTNKDSGKKTTYSFHGNTRHVKQV